MNREIVFCIQPRHRGQELKPKVIHYLQTSLDGDSGDKIEVVSHNLNFGCDVTSISFPLMKSNFSSVSSTPLCNKISFSQNRSQALSISSNMMKLSCTDVSPTCTSGYPSPTIDTFQSLVFEDLTTSVLKKRKMINVDDNVSHVSKMSRLSGESDHDFSTIKSASNIPQSTILSFMQLK